MADLHSASGPGDARPDPEDDPGTPRWAKVFGIVAVVLVLLFVALASRRRRLPRARELTVTSVVPAMPPGVRKAALTAHVAASVGWLGAVAAFLALAVVGLTSGEAQRVRAVYVAMDVIGWSVIVPLCLASFVTGVVTSLGTAWDLFRHYWFAIQLLLTVLATAVLLVHMRPISHVAGVAGVAVRRSLAAGDLRAVCVQLTVDAGAALLVLLVTTTLSVGKPRGLTARGRRALRATSRILSP